MMFHMHNKERQTAFSFQQIIEFFLYVAIVLLVLLRDIGRIPFSKYAIISIAFVISLVTNVDGLFCLAAFISPLHSGLSGTYIVIIILGMYIVKKRRFSLSIGSILAICLILIIEALSSLRGYFEVGNYIRFICYFLLFSLGLLDANQRLPGKTMLKMFVLGLLTALVSLFGQMLHMYSIKSILSLGIRLGSVETNMVVSNAMTVSFNSNDLGFLCAIMAGAALFLYSDKKSIIWIFIVALSAVVTIMTQSRGGLVTFLLVIIGYFLLNANKILKRMLTLVGGIVILLLLLQLAYKLIPSYFENLLLRLKTEDITNGRNEIFMFYMNGMLEYPERFLLGVGLQNYAAKYDYYMSSHMMLQEIMIAWGLVGLVAFIYLFIVIIRKAQARTANRRPVYLVPFGALFVGLQTGQGFSAWHHFLYFMITIAFVYLRGDKRNDGIKEG